MIPFLNRSEKLFKKPQTNFNLKILQRPHFEKHKCVTLG